MFEVDWAFYAPTLIRAVGRTVEFTVLGFTGAVLVGLIVALMRVSAFGLLRMAARIYTEIFRNLPLITELFIIYFGLASLGIRLDVLSAGALSLSLFYGAYLSEIFRGALQGVHRTQREAALASGLGPVATFRHVILPQAVRLALPGTSTMLVDLLKGTSLMVTIGGAELMTEAGVIVGDTFRAMEVYVVIGVIYVAMAYPLSQLSLRLEQRLHDGGPLSPRRRRTWRAIRRLQEERA